MLIRNHRTQTFFALSFCLMAVLPCLAGKPNSKPADGKQVFQQHCASCHQSGCIDIKPVKAIKGSKQLASLAIFKHYLSAPPGHMPYYQNLVNDPQLLQSLYTYCKQLKVDSHKQAAHPSVRDATAVAAR